jgi:hypothetical protein
MEGCEIQGIFRDETKQDDSKGRKTNKQSHVDVDVTITNKNKSTKASLGQSYIKCPGVKHL